MARKKRVKPKKATGISRDTLERLIAPKKRTKGPKRPKVDKEIETVWKETIEKVEKWDKKAVSAKLAEKGLITPPLGKASKAKEIEIEPKPTLSERLFGKLKSERYDIKKHGTLVDLSLPKDVPYKVLETYTVYEPYVYIRIIEEPATHERYYHVLEPKLTRAEKKLFDELRTRLIETLDINLKELKKEGALRYLKRNANEILADYRIELSSRSKERIMYYIVREFLDYGKIAPIMKDPNIEDISCDGANIPIFVYHKKYESIRTNVIFENEERLDSFIIRFAQMCGRHISIADPLLDGTLPDGSRVQLTLGREVTAKGSTFTVRKFRESPLTPPDLIDLHTFSTAAIAYLWLAVECGKSIIFAGGTASGKTTTLNAIALFIPPEMKIVSIEDTRELNIPHPNWIPSVTREVFGGEAKGAIDMYELLRAALRQRPEYLIVGEIRGKEAYVLFQAMATGHITFSTMHADSVVSIVNRLEQPPLNIPRILFKSLDIISIQTQARVGEQRVRRMKTLTEVVDIDPRTGELLTNEVFRWVPASDEFEYTGRSYVLEDIMEKRSWDEKKMKREFERRQEVLEWMKTKKITHYEDVAKIVVTYYREPKKLMKIIRR